jgi:hypothetical protein
VVAYALMSKRYRDNYNRTNGAPGAMPTGKKCLAVVNGGHEHTVAAANGWTVTHIALNTGGVWPSRTAIAEYDLLVVDWHVWGLDATSVTNVQNAWTDGVSIYTTGNDTGALSPLYTGVAGDDGTNSTISPSGTHSLSAGWSAFTDSDLGLYLTGVNASAVTFATGVSGGVTRPIGVAMEDPTTGARWVHLHPYSSTHPSGLDAAIYGWLSERWQRPLTWEAVSGAASISSNELLFSTAGSSNPIYAVDVGLRANGKADVDVSATPRHVYGNALYARVVDANDWIRARLQSYTTSYQYYETETLWNNNMWYDSYTARTLEYYWSYTTTYPGYWTMGTWSGWSNTGEQTACRIDYPGYGTDPVYGSSGNVVTEYRWVSNGMGVGCAADKSTYRKQSRSRSESWTPETSSTSYQWSASSPGSGWVNTGQSRYVNGSGYSKTAGNKSATNPGQTTSPNGTYDLYNSTALFANGTYWAVYKSSTVDTSAGQTRQVGPYTGYNYYYGEVILEKCVAGVITRLGTAWLSNSTTPQVMRLRAKGSTLEVYYQGTLRVTATDATHATTGTKVGVGGAASDYNQTSARMDDFICTLLSPHQVRNAADTAWLSVERPKVRNATDAAWVDVDPMPDYPSGRVAHLAPATLGAAAGAAVTSAPAVGSNAAWTALGAGPIFRASGVNGKPYLEQDSTGRGLRWNQSLTGDNTVFVAARMRGTLNGRILSGLNNNYLLGWHANTEDDLYGEGWVNNSSAAASTNLRIYAARRSGTTTSFWRAAVSSGAPVVSNTASAAGPNGLSTNGHAGGSEFSDADLYEVIAFNRALSDAEVAVVLSRMRYSFLP